MADPPPAPWHLVGECVLAWARAGSSLRELVPAGLRPLPGPAAVVGVRYTDSPVGPYLELSVGVPARLGARPGLCIVSQWVSLPAARLAYRSNWGLPAVLGDLSWESDGRERAIRCDEPAIEVRGVPVGPALPAAVPVRSLQRRSDGPAVLRRRFLALARLARAEILVDADDDPALMTLAGRHPGAVMAGVRIVAHPARHPFGLWSSLGAPLRVIEPALAGEPPAQLLQSPPSRALSSAG